MSLSRRNLIVKLCCPLVVLSSRNISESSSSTSTSIQPNSAAPACGHHLTSHSLTRPPSRPRESPSPPPPGTINACRPARWTEMRCQPGTSPSQITPSTLFSGAPATGTASVYGGPSTSEPVRALSWPSSRLPLEMIPQFSRCLQQRFLTLESALQARLKTDSDCRPFPRDGF